MTRTGVTSICGERTPGPRAHIKAFDVCTHPAGHGGDHSWVDPALEDKAWPPHTLEGKDGGQAGPG